MCIFHSHPKNLTAYLSTMILRCLINSKWSFKVCMHDVELGSTDVDYFDIIGASTDEKNL